MFLVHASLDNRTPNRLRISSDSRYQRASDPIDDRWIGVKPPGHTTAGKRGRPVLLRPGMLTPAQIEAVCGQPLQQRDDQAPRASGTLESHYAPQAKVRLMDAAQIQSALDVLGADARHIAVYSRGRLKSASKHLVQRAMPADAAACAQELFAVLRGFDDAGVRLIWIETPPPAPEWDGVRDRLQRAAA